MKIQDSTLVVRGFNSSCSEAFTPGQRRAFKNAFSLVTVSLCEGPQYGAK